MKYDIATRSAPGHREVEGEAFGQYGVHAATVRNGDVELTAYFLSHLPTGRRLGTESSGFAGFHHRETAVRIAQLWAEHAPSWCSDHPFGSSVESSPQILAFYDAIIERVANENHLGVEKCGPFEPPALTP